MNVVRAIRLAAGLTQAEFARRAGTSQPSIAVMESGQRNPSPAMLARLRAAAKPRPSLVLAERRFAVLELAGDHKATDVRVFGSVARGEDVSGSDIDLLVRFEADADIFDLADLVADLEELTGLDVDVVSEGGLAPGPNPIRDQAIAL
jgi:predicted nucleotidyltransferase